MNVGKNADKYIEKEIEGSNFYKMHGKSYEIVILNLLVNSLVYVYSFF